jgi:large subunit ribosomal protein L11
MVKEKINVLVEGGKATAAPPLGPALGPMGVNIGQVVADINRKTAEFKGMQVPVTVIVDKDTKKHDITVGTPPASALIKKEANLEKGSGKPNTEKVADILIEQIIKIAKMKGDDTLGRNMKQKVKEIVGTCDSMGILVEGKPARETMRDIENGVFDEEIRLEKTELTAEELAKLEEERKHLAEELAKKREMFLAQGKTIMDTMAGKEPREIKKALEAAKIPAEIIKELMPAEAAPAAGAPSAGAAPAAAAAKK